MRIVAALFLFSTITVHAAIIDVVNPSFELVAAGTPLDGQGIYSFSTSSHPFGWTVASGTIEVVQAGYGGYWTSQDGSYSVDMNGTSAGSISQVISGLTAGNQYELVFGLSANPNWCGLCLLQVEIGNVMALFPAGGAMMTWADQTVAFTASGTSTTLTFTALSGGAGGAVIDNVRLADAAGVPEPASACLLLIGLAALARRVRRQVR